MTAFAAKILMAVTAFAVTMPAGATAAAGSAPHPGRDRQLQAALDGIVSAGSPGEMKSFTDLLDRSFCAR